MKSKTIYIDDELDRAAKKCKVFPFYFLCDLETRTQILFSELKTRHARCGYLALFSFYLEGKYTETDGFVSSEKEWNERCWYFMDKYKNIERFHNIVKIKRIIKDVMNQFKEVTP